ncbi:MAG: PTS lactose/cellobiose transporter subunit IIA [Lacrimispora sp.]|uniref:PTS lactose/cellobiose transporter subunit IIA n=1 Tax=Lacrimispora sp. TaxID=2719234 RepID=UPI0039E6064D
MEKALYKDEDKVVKVAMEIVIAAGEARNKAGKALDYVEAFDFEQAKKHLEEARKDILKAHNAQTDMIQAEISGEESIPPSLLFNHAQDTLMTIMTEVNLTEKMIMLFEKFYKKMEEGT